MKDAARILCDHCVYWNRFKPTSSIGHCRIKPPYIINHVCAWPVTHGDMWCGEGFDGASSFVGALARLDAEARSAQVTADFEAFTERLSPMHPVTPPGGPGAFGGGGGGLSDLVTIIYKKPDDWGGSSA